MLLRDFMVAGVCVECSTVFVLMFDGICVYVSRCLRCFVFWLIVCVLMFNSICVDVVLFRVTVNSIVLKFKRICVEFVLFRVMFNGIGVDFQ